MSERIHAVIMAGGSGTRFWPASRRLRPKQLLALAGSEPLLKQQVDRVVPLCGLEHVFVATGEHLVQATLDAVPALRREQLLVEPVARNTAPCLGWAAAVVARTDPEAVVMALPADPHIRDDEVFRRALRAAVAQARRGVITTIGIRPTHPETGYGYLETGMGSAGADGALTVKRFVEKPDRARAEQFLEAGNYFWNAGMFFYRAGDMLRAIEEHLPELSRGLAALDAAAEKGQEAQALPQVFPTLPSISIDHGVMEKMEELAMVPGDFGWSDLGSWSSAYELADKDERGNHAPDGTVLLDASGNLVVDMRSGDDARVTAVVGMQDLVVVQTDDAVLVMPRDQAQRVKEIVAELKRRGDDAFV
jgi:mannose-1-phosphate guanylyltransferase